MADRTTIEWSDANLAPVAALMAAVTQSNHIEPVAPLVSEMMVVFDSRATAIETGKVLGRREAAHLDGITDGVNSSLLDGLVGSTENDPLPTDLHARTVNAGSCESVASTPISVEGRRWLPRFASGACLEAGVTTGQIIFETKAQTTSGCLESPQLRAHEWSI